MKTRSSTSQGVV